MNKSKINSILLGAGALFGIGACFLSGTSLGEHSQGMLYLTIIVAVIVNFSKIKKSISDSAYESAVEAEDTEREFQLEKERKMAEARERIKLRKEAEESGLKEKEIEEKELQRK